MGGASGGAAGSAAGGAAGGTIKQTQSAVVLENLIGQFLFNKAADAGSAVGSAASGGTGSAADAGGKKP